MQLSLSSDTLQLENRVLPHSLKIEISQDTCPYYHHTVFCCAIYKQHGRKTVILIDEYDVPLDKAFQNGYYKEMVSLIRAIFGKALKTNEALDFAVLTGCLRVSKESIFTGLNNFKILSITIEENDYNDLFGDTDYEFDEMRTYKINSFALTNIEAYRSI